MLINREDYLDSLFNSSNIDDIKKFYYSFDGVDDLVTWMKNRPSARIDVYEFEGRKDVIFVIPTPTIDSELTKSLLYSIKGYSSMVVESSGPYFNFARSVNRGVEAALKYNPKWIIISNNDIIINEKIDNITNKILSTDEEKYDTIIGASGIHTFELCEFSRLFDYIYFINDKMQILKKFGIKYFLNIKKPFFDYICKPLIKVKGISFFGEFMIVSSHFVRNRLEEYGYFLDPTFINGVEDMELFLEVLNKSKYTTIRNTNIIHLAGKSLGVTNLRYWKNLVNFIYLNYKITNNLLLFPKNLDLELY